MRLLSIVQSVAIATLLGGAAVAQEDTSAAVAAQPAAINTNNVPEKPSVIPNSAATYAQFHDEFVRRWQSSADVHTDQIEEKLNTIGGQNASKLTSGWMSYSALVAAQDSEFAHSVRDIDGYYGRDRLAGRPGERTPPMLSHSTVAVAPCNRLWPQQKQTHSGLAVLQLSSSLRNARYRASPGSNSASAMAHSAPSA